MAQETRQFVLEVSPDQVDDSLPVGLVEDAKAGFQDVNLSITTSTGEDVLLIVSFDGESEIIAKIISKPEGISDEEIDQTITNFFTEEEEVAA